MVYRRLPAQSATDIVTIISSSVVLTVDLRSCPNEIICVSHGKRAQTKNVSIYQSKKFVYVLLGPNAHE